MLVEELEAVGDDYYQALEVLTNSSRPIISNLTQLAQENVNAAQFITKAIEKRLEKAPPSQKLCVFYLLDSICKNTGSPYTLLFGNALFQTFTQAYLLVDEMTRKKFIDLFKTWKSATTSSGLPLFPQEPVDRIEQFLIRASTIYQQQQINIRNTGTPPPSILPQLPQPQPHSHGHGLGHGLGLGVGVNVAHGHLLQQNGGLNNLNSFNNTSPLIPIVDKLLHLTNQRLLQNPHDQTISQKIQVINSLKDAIQSEALPPLTIQQIKARLDDMTKQEEALLRFLAPPNQQQQQQQQQQQIRQEEPTDSSSLSQPQQQSPQHNRQQQQNPLFNMSVFLQKSDPKIENPPNSSLVSNNNSSSSASSTTNLLSNLLNLKTSSIPTIPTAKPKPDLSNLLSKLEQKGLVKKPKLSSSSPSSSSPTSAVNSTSGFPSTSTLKSLLLMNSANSSPSNTSTLSSNQPPNLSNLNINSKDYESLTLLKTFDITSKFLTLDNTQIFKFFFEVKLSNKCGTCGKRFSNTPRGTLLKREHLDWHFRINKKLKENSIVQSRSWYLDDEEFVQFKDDEIFTSIKDDDGSALDPHSNGAGAGGGAGHNSEKKKKANYVLVPGDSTDMKCVCGICKEVIKGSFDDDLGEWVFKNSVSSNDRIFHESCWDETSKTGGLTTKLVLKRGRDGEKKVDLSALQYLISGLNKSKVLFNEDSNEPIGQAQLKDEKN